ncbi:50S ribosomal protein L33 [Mycoplasmopsis agalactiae 14628]|uniref:Large ribosomal subunit protein bL33A n=3 Tax=Mycoplasmopsis agalactiae TaxID=2110 RepID=RL331_MYCAP|nr:50S ribosomal protein L33 [Mycoplasmopsis agalactiae]A5IXI1.1 RecName: Full=Large ribosomal subunit protein bL33A; AltName: Full=50S ribosomal protein L33 1 [Mycoplasmopsis agalactiae PG2]EIN14868.1 50S ribosomal protein L33 [Mycoplasmopsis agalactiae 14628]KAB6718747.1 50S ribosomal protein L33 [Mycoplasmopsis agalactiae]MCE6056043.1 50S ribosomal protein L33 [Mycoplasmopsis agalactiae]MCE6056844.1 50S ribosomal protein L33 [Mycoplasmopsis agalactiae]MCE6061342.1 50S ribosomal protein L33
MLRKKVTLSCEECHSMNYSTNKSLMSVDRITVKKFCRKCNKHTMHKEEK